MKIGHKSISLANGLEKFPSDIKPIGVRLVENPLDFVPTMTSHTTPSPYVISASSEYPGGGCEAWRAFDNDLNTQWETNEPLNPPEWLMVDFGVGNEKIVGGYTIEAPYADAAPKYWNFVGSNDGENWTYLDHREDLYWGRNEKKKFIFANSTAYRYYRIRIYEYNNKKYGDVFEIELLPPYPTTSPISTITFDIPSNNISDIASPLALIELPYGTGSLEYKYELNNDGNILPADSRLTLTQLQSTLRNAAITVHTDSLRVYVYHNSDGTQQADYGWDAAQGSLDVAEPAPSASFQLPLETVDISTEYEVVEI